VADQKRLIAELYAGLQAFSSSSFPKRCHCCGRSFQTPEDFLKQTEDLRNSTGLKESWASDEQTVVELFRNCPCGSTLMELFGDRRDMSETGIRRREKFRELLDLLTAEGMDQELARTELLKVLRGETSVLLRERGVDIQTH
jgi:hypothetical protein